LGGWISEAPVNFLSLIEAKRDGRSLSSDQIAEIIAACVAGKIPDYQLAAFLMAVFFRGLSVEETRAMTMAMRDSGDVLRFPADPRPLVDKHSTGGVGDKVSLPLAPLLACLGMRVPMISGRGLGITGGTLDKLDSIPGFRTALPADRIVEVVQEVGCVICGQTERMVPADRILYALRDVTGTVASIPLIVSSILSKKLAEGLQALVLDVKFGAAAFMATKERAHELASAMTTLGGECGVNTRALISRMESPLGRAAGNWLEVKESVACLEPSKGSSSGGESIADLRELVLECAAQLLVQTGKRSNLSEARREAEACLASGEPRKKWNQMMAAQGANLDEFERKLARDTTAPVVLELKAETSGFVSRCDARLMGEVIRDLGGGRLTRESAVHYEVGVDRILKPGESVERGAILARLHAQDDRQARAALERLRAAFEISDRPPELPPLIAETVIQTDR
jgi:pyrimidine-nucleoside phosphorylase